jgi:hypothetical protein
MRLSFFLLSLVARRAPVVTRDSLYVTLLDAVAANDTAWFRAALDASPEGGWSFMDFSHGDRGNGATYSVTLLALAATKCNAEMLNLMLYNGADPSALIDRSVGTSEDTRARARELLRRFCEEGVV